MDLSSLSLMTSRAMGSLIFLVYSGKLRSAQSLNGMDCGYWLYSSKRMRLQIL